MTHGLNMNSTASLLVNASELSDNHTATMLGDWSIRETYDLGEYNSTNDTAWPGGTGDSLYTPLYIPVCVGIFNGIVFLTGILGNSLVMLVVCRVREMRSSTNYFLISLSAADALVLLICQPSAILEFYAQDRWLLGSQMCRLVPFLENSVAYTSILTLLVISIERYVAICHPFRVHSTFTERKTAQAVLLVWVTSFILSTPFIVLTQEEVADFYDGSKVNVCKTRMQETWHHAYLILTFAVLFLVPMLALIVLYSSIIYKLRTEVLEIGQCSDPRDRRQVVVMLLSVIILFFVCLLPVRVLTLWKVYTTTENIQALGLEGYFNLIWFARIMMYINSAGNPIIYNLVSTKFRNAFLRCLPFVRRKTGGFRRGCYQASQPSFTSTFIQDFRDGDSSEARCMVREMYYMNNFSDIELG